jgi:hypothetical protein
MEVWQLYPLLILLVQLEHVAPELNHPPTVFISVLIRNKAPVLPYFLTQLSSLSYPKQRIVLHLRSDHNEDNSLEVGDVSNQLTNQFILFQYQ